MVVGVQLKDMVERGATTGYGSRGATEYYGSIGVQRKDMVV
jgi:hypothetical protein